MASSPSPQKAKKRPISRSNSGGFFACFRPAVADRDDHLLRSRSNPVKDGIDERGVTAYIAFDDGKKADTLPGIAPCPRGCKGEVDDRPPKDSARKRFARATKAVFLEMLLVKKVQKMRKPKKTEEPNGDLFKKADRILRLMSHGRTARKNDSCEDSTRSDYYVSISSHSSAAARSLSWTCSNRLLSPRGSSSNSLDVGAAKLVSRSISSEPKRIAQDRPVVVQARRFKSLADAPMYLILLTLAVLILWGMVCAIVFTFTCLVVALPTGTPRRGSKDEGEESVDSAEYKKRKRIIMEGLLKTTSPCPATVAILVITSMHFGHNLHFDVTHNNHEDNV